jgi:hypothetical protein
MTSAVTLAQLAAANSPLGYRNKLINGSFDIWQRGTSFNNLSNVYTADRWKIGYQDDGAIYTQQTSDLAGFNLYMRMIKGGTTFGSHMIQQAIETTNCADLIGQRVVFSCWARLSNATTQANHILSMALGFSATTDYSGWLNSADICSFYGRWTAAGATGVTFQAGSTGANSFAPSQSSGTLTTTWQRYFYTLIVPTNTRTVVCGVYSENTVQNGGIDVAGLQMEIGSVPTAFDRRHIQQETAMAQRYFYQISSTGAANGENTGITGLSDGGNNAYRTNIALPVTMRVVPTMSVSNLSGSGTDLRAFQGNTVRGITSLGTQFSNTGYVQADWVMDGGMSLGQYITFLWRDNRPNSWIRFNAEI